MLSQMLVIPHWKPLSRLPCQPDDGNACTTDACDTSTGQITHTPVNIDDNACTTDACDTSTGAITHTAAFQHR